MNAPDLGRSEHERSARSDDVPAGTRSSAAGGFPALGGGGRGVGRSELGGRVLKPYYPSSWFDPVGHKKILRRLFPRLPRVSGSLWGTLTVDPERFPGPAEAFAKAREHIRKVFFALRKGVVWNGHRYVLDGAYCVKVEFHKSGWAHFHFIFLTRRFLPGELLTHLWGLGHTLVDRITDDGFRYLLKYVSKDGAAPEWVRALHRIRIFQTSPGFLLPKAKAANKRKALPSKRSRKADTIGERLARWSRMGTLVDGKIHRQILLTRPYREILAEEVMTVAEEGRYLGDGKVIIGGSKDLRPWKMQK